MKENLLRSLLDAGRPTVGTRIWSAWPVIAEACASTGSIDYIEFVAEYAPFTQFDLENLARACENSGVASMIKVDFQNRFYVAQRATAAGFQAVLFTDHTTAAEVEESVYNTYPSVCGEGRFGFSNNRWIGYQPYRTQTEHAQAVKKVVRAFMIEKAEAMENIEEICSVPGVDMVQFGPSDYCMSRGWDLKDHRKEAREAEEKMIRVALEHGVAPRCECDTLEKAEYYRSLGVRHFSIGDEIKNLLASWNGALKAVKEMSENL